MRVTFIRDKNRYVDSAGRQATVVEHGRDFYNCTHDFQDTGTRGETPSVNGRRAPAAAYQCAKCLVFTIVELKK